MLIEVEFRAPDLDGLTDAELSELVWGDPQLCVQPVLEEEHVFGGMYYASTRSLDDDDYHAIKERFEREFLANETHIYRIRKDKAPWDRIPEFDQDRDLGMTDEEIEIAVKEREQRIATLQPAVRDKIKESIVASMATMSDQEEIDTAQSIIDAIEIQEKIEVASAGQLGDKEEEVEVEEVLAPTGALAKLMAEEERAKSVVDDDGVWDLNRLMGRVPKTLEDLDKAEEARQMIIEPEPETLLFCVIPILDTPGCYVTVTPKSFWNANKYLNDAGHDLEDNIPPGIKCDSESMYSTDLNKSDAIALMNTVKDFEYSQELEDFMQE